MTVPLVANVSLDASLNKYSLEYQYSDLSEATGDFAEEYRLGKGSYGAVFRGIQSDGTDVAIKVLDGPESTGFMEEVRVLSKFRHPNLVTLMGFARRGSLRFLVYELLDGDLFQRLRKCDRCEKSFSWTERISVLFDAACGLSHLHNSTPKVFHRDIKSANILLDRSGKAKMADFGLACLSHSSSEKVELTTGTMGYADPLYVQTAIVTEGSEVYSFGMVTFEVLTALPPCQRQKNPDGTQGYAFLKDQIKGDIQVAQTLLDCQAKWPSHLSQALLEFAFTCTQGNQEMRPKFTSIVKMLRILRDRPAAGATQPVDVSLPKHIVSEVRRTSVSAAPVCRTSASPRTPNDQGCKSQSPAPAPMAPRTPSPYRSSAMKENHATTPRISSPAREDFAGRSIDPMQAATHASLQAVAKESIEASHTCSGTLLWVLECIEVEGTDLTYCRDDKYSIRHVHHEQGKPMMTTLRVGRMVQADFFTSLIPDQKLFEAVSRDHFHIWAQNTMSIGTSFTFWLMNCSANGTLVNGQYLRTAGEQIQIHDGDIISLARNGAYSTEIVPFFSFRFSLAGSILNDTVQAPKVHVNCEVERAVSPSSSERSAGMETSDVVPEFLLEVGGSGLIQNKNLKNVLQHGAYGSHHCPDFLLGRAQQPEFWKTVLCRRAYEMLSRKHLKFETSKDTPTGKSASRVENLVADKEVFIYNPLRGMSPQDATTLRMNEMHDLRHGDIIILNPSHDCVVWLLFIDGERSSAAKAWNSPEICASRAAAASSLGGA